MAKPEVNFHASTPLDKAFHFHAPDMSAGRELLLAGRFQLHALIGKGSMGSVYRAQDQRTGMPCAIKMLSSTAAADEEECIRFANEATVISQIFHPNIVEVREFRRDELGRLFLVMELLDGMDLHTYLQQHGSLSLERVQHIVRQVASALHAVHGLGIVHRDIKPRNIFLAKQRSDQTVTSEFVKVVDFGLSKIIGGLQHETALGIILGTPEYLAPEGTLGRSRLLEERTDQWALAAMAFRMLSGRLPFEDDDVIKLMMRIRQDPTPSLCTLVPQLPKYAANAIERGLSKRKEDRFPSIREFAQALCGEQSGFSVSRTRAPLASVPVLIPHDVSRPISRSETSCARFMREQRVAQAEQTMAIQCHALELLLDQTRSNHDEPKQLGTSQYQLQLEANPSAEKVVAPACAVVATPGSAIRLRYPRVYRLALAGLLVTAGLGTAGWYLGHHGRWARLGRDTAVKLPDQPQPSPLPAPAATVPPRTAALPIPSLPLVVARRGPEPAPVRPLKVPSPTPVVAAERGPTPLVARAPQATRSAAARGNVEQSMKTAIPPAPATPPASGLPPPVAPDTEPLVPDVKVNIPAEVATSQEVARATAPVPARVVQKQLKLSPIPEATYSPEPSVPFSLRATLRGVPLDGTYLLYVAVDGSVTDVQTVHAVPLANDSIVEGLRRWRYKASKSPVVVTKTFQFLY